MQAVLVIALIEIELANAHMNKPAREYIPYLAEFLSDARLGQQWACEAEFVAIWVGQVEEALAPFGITGLRGVQASRECALMKCIDIGDSKN
jgi:hypothetical protein